MSALATSPETAVAAQRRPRPWTWTRRRLGIGGLIALGVLVLLALVALLAPVIAPHDPYAYNISDAFAGLSPAHPLGTDKLGRDILSRLMFGARTSLLGPLLVVLLATFGGVPLGIVLAWVGGRFDAVVSRILDVLFAFPAILLGALTVAIFGVGLTPCVIAVGISYVPWAARAARGAALRERGKPYIAAVEVQGVSGAAICARHLLPNIWGLVVAQAAVAFGYALVDLAALSFLGFGVQPPQADWGVLVNDYDEILQGHPEQAMMAGALIVIAVMCFTAVGTALERRMEPDR